MNKVLLLSLLGVLAFDSCSRDEGNPISIFAPPDVPQLALPADGAIDQSTSLTLKWNASDGAESYYLQISKSNSFDSLVQDHAGLTSTSLQITGLSYNTKYSWRVNAKNGNGTSKWSGIWSFTTIGTAPSIPALALPADGAIDQPTSPILSWNPSSGATSYALQVSTSKSFDSCVVNDSGLTSSSHQVSGLANVTTFYWRVNAKNGNGTSKWSGIWSFTTEKQIIYGRYSGFLFGIVVGDTMVARYAKIKVDQSRECHADSNGRFLIDSVVEGSHLLSITHDDFFPYDTTADTRDSAQIVVKLNSRLRDCLPLYIGNQWTYTYQYREGTASTGRFDNVDATFTWEVISLSAEGLEIKYKVTEVCDSMHVQSPGQPTYHIDTTYGHSSGSFYFVEARDHRITIASVDGIVHVKDLPREFSTQAFYRYSRPDPYTGNVSMFQGSERYPYSSVAKVDTGIVTHYFNPALGINYRNYWVSLASCILQPPSTGKR